jgi:hypothetical protein
MRRLGCLVALALLAGCAAPPTERPAEAVPVPAGAEPDPWQGRSSILVASQEWGTGTFALDFLCVFGGEWYVPRTGEIVLNGTASFNVSVETGPFYTGLEVGLQFRDEEILWLEAVANERRVFDVPVQPEQWETADDKQWTFWYRDTIAGNRELCYSGASFGERTISVEAVKG